MGSFLLDLLEFIALVLFVRAMVRSVGSAFRFTRIHVRPPGGVAPPRPAEDSHRGAMARDPVCGIFVSTELPHQLRHGSETLHFCSHECLIKYQKDGVNATS
jgi:YHS domain-containing protein